MIGRGGFFMHGFRTLGFIEYNGKFHDWNDWRPPLGCCGGGRSIFTLEIGARGLLCRIDDLFHRLP
jgi:hypothetical protein